MISVLRRQMSHARPIEVHTVQMVEVRDTRLLSSSPEIDLFERGIDVRDALDRVWPGLDLILERAVTAVAVQVRPAVTLRPPDDILAVVMHLPRLQLEVRRRRVARDQRYRAGLRVYRRKLDGLGASYRVQHEQLVRSLAPFDALETERVARIHDGSILHLDAALAVDIDDVGIVERYHRI